MKDLAISHLLLNRSLRVQNLQFTSDCVCLPKLTASFLHLCASSSERILKVHGDLAFGLCQHWQYLRTILIIWKFLDDKSAISVVSAISFSVRPIALLAPLILAFITQRCSQAIRKHLKQKTLQQ